MSIESIPSEAGTKLKWHAAETDRDDLAPIPSGKGEMRVLSHLGDKKTVWDKNNPDEVEAARIEFEHFKKKGYLCYSVDGKDKGKQLLEFDPNVERLIYSPPMKGG